jgi:exosortase
LVLGIAWVFWPALWEMGERWGSDPRYSHGYLVPVFSLYLLWSRRGKLAEGEVRPSWLGLPVLLAGLVGRAAGLSVYVEWVAAAAVIVCLTGAVLLVGGRTALKWAWPALAFLLFMVPLPYRVETALAHPLQRIATVVSTYALETIGFVTVAEGNTIRMGSVRLGVVEACSGLSMMMIFLALGAATAIVVRRPWYEKLLLVASALPIAVVANITRITVTGVLYKTTTPELAEYVFHDLAGWLMMPFALVLLWAEMRALSWLVVDDLRTSAAPKLYGVPKSRGPSIKPPPRTPAAPATPPAATPGRP